MNLTIPYDKILSIARQLAKSNYWQALYAQAKELGGLYLFENNRNFTELQIYFLSQLSFYNSLYIDIYMGDVSEKVLEHEIYEDAYSYYKSWKRKKEKKYKKATVPDEKITDYHKDKKAVVNQNQWVFTKIKGQK